MYLALQIFPILLLFFHYNKCYHFIQQSNTFPHPGLGNCAMEGEAGEEILKALVKPAFWISLSALCASFVLKSIEHSFSLCSQESCIFEKIFWHGYK